MLSACKNFFITLLIAAALFGVIAYFATQFVTATVSDIMDDEEAAFESIMTQEKDPETETDADTADPEGQPAEDVTGKSFAFAIVATGYRPDLFDDYVPTVEALRNQIANFQMASDSYGILNKEYRKKDATAIVLVRVDKEKKQITYTYISPETRVFTDTGYHTLGEVHTYYGYQRVGDYVTSLTGIRLDYTFLLEGYNFDEFLSLFGTVWVKNPKDIYAEGKIHTTRSETIRNRVNDDGTTATDRYPNSLVLSAGSLEVNQYAANILNTLKERSGSDIDAKGTYATAIVQEYMTKIAGMDEAEFRSLMEGALVMSEKENAVKTWLSDGSVRLEPATPVFESNFTLDHVSVVYELLHASASFTHEVIAYPGNYITATENVDAYYNPDLKTAIKRFLPYRFPVEAKDAAQ